MPAILSGDLHPCDLHPCDHYPCDVAEIERKGRPRDGVVQWLTLWSLTQLASRLAVATEARPRGLRVEWLVRCAVSAGRGRR